MPKADKPSKKRHLTHQATGYTPPPKAADQTKTPFKVQPGDQSLGNRLLEEESPLLPLGAESAPQTSTPSKVTQRGRLQTIDEYVEEEEEAADLDYSDVALGRFYGPTDDNEVRQPNPSGSVKASGRTAPAPYCPSSPSSSSDDSSDDSSDGEFNYGYDQGAAGGNDGEDGDDDQDDQVGDEEDDDMAPHEVKGSEALTIQTFDGAEGVQIHTWCRSVDRAITQFNWDDEPAAAAAKQRLVGRAAFWLQQEESKKTNLDSWETMRKALIKRFYPVVTDLMATDAMKELRQKQGESGGEFLDRVWSAIHLMNMRVETDTYQQCCLAIHNAANSRYVRHLFGTGIHQTTRDKIYQSHNPPTKLDELLAAVRTVEAETRAQGHIVAEDATVPKKSLEKSLRIVTSAAAQVQSSAEDDDANSTEASDIEVLVEAMRKFTTKGKCFTCNKEGHWANKCPNKGQGGGSRGRKGNRWNGNRGRGRGGYQGQGGWRQPPFNFNYGGGNSRPVNAMDAAAAAYHQFQQQQSQQQSQAMAPQMFGQWQQPTPDGQDFPSDVNALTNSFLANYPHSGN